MDESGLNNIFISVARNFHWLPSQIKELFLDNEDVDGLLFWYEYVVSQDEEVTRQLASIKNQKKQ